MAEIVKMPKMSDTMTDGVIAKWHKHVGDTIKSGDLVAEIETDKATMDFEAFQEGTLLYIGSKEGESVPVDGVIAIVGKAGEDYTSLLGPQNGVLDHSEGNESTGTPPESPKAPEDSKATEQAAEHAPGQAPVRSSDERIKVSPLAKKLAEDKGISLSLIKGSADNGRIVKRDIEQFDLVPVPAPVQISSRGEGAPKPAKEAIASTSSYEDLPVSQMRKTIAKRLSESMFTAPHFYITMSIGMGKTSELREQINSVSSQKISFNDIILKAVAVCLKKHPKVNSSWLGDKIRINHDVHIGVAVAIEDGLLVPVIRNADIKTLSKISVEVKELAQKAKEKKLQPSDWEGSTFTISNLGMMGVEEFTAIINPPDSCILAIGGVLDAPVVERGTIVAGKVMKVTLSSDHRVVDGLTGAAFLQDLKKTLEEPLTLLV